MSTTRSTSDLPYTVVGGRSIRDPARRTGMAAVVLNRGGRPVRVETIAPFAECGADEALVVLGPKPHYEVEQLVARFPTARFLLLSRDANVGEQINIAVHEARCPQVFTLWSDMAPPAVTRRTVTKVDELDSVCVVPLIKNERNETIPSVHAPAFYRTLFRTVPTLPGSEGELSLYPYAGTAVFDTERFDRLGGFDPVIRNPYWQQLDFGVRAYLWGEQIRVLPSLRVQATRPLPSEDTTPDAGYARFHLKNLSVRFVRDYGRLPLQQLVPFVMRSGLGVAEGLRQFRDARAWVSEHRYRYAQDARRLTELWEVAE